MKAKFQTPFVLWAIVSLMAGSSSLRGQWLTQTNTLKPGWNAVFLHVDASHNTLTNLIAADAANPILEVWLWAPTVSTMQYIDSPLNPLDSGSQWVSWNRTNNASSALQRLIGNAAYLVRVGTNVTSYTWTVKGKPVPPKYQWTTTGLNFLGFPTVPVNPPSFETFLSQAPALLQNAEVYQYVGGDLGATNPARVFTLRSTKVDRGKAFWMRSGDYFNRYFGPFEVALSKLEGVAFGENLSVASFRLRNLTASNLTVTLRLLASETPPAGQSNIANVPPLLVRGSMNASNLTYTYASLGLGGTYTWNLTAQGLPGSEAEVVLGLNRSVIANPPGTLLAGILRLTDSFSFSQVDVPVSATPGSSAGLWVGGASVWQVGEYLKTYSRDINGNPIPNTNGAYIVTGLNTDLGSVSHPFDLRLIVHNPAAGNAVLLQRVYYGVDANTNPVVTTRESVLNRNLLNQARRMSATHLPWSATNQTWLFDGRFGAVSNLAVTVTLPYTDQASNPFLHTYHPDHDNLKDRFDDVQAQGAESYTVQRSIRLSVLPPADDFGSLTSGSDTLTGAYAETITILGLAREGGTDSRQFEVNGLFTLNRLSEIPVLTLP